MKDGTLASKFPKKNLVTPLDLLYSILQADNRLGQAGMKLLGMNNRTFLTLSIEVGEKSFFTGLSSSHVKRHRSFMSTSESHDVTLSCCIKKDK